MAIYGNEHVILKETIHHSSDELSRFPNVWQQFQFRLDLCRSWGETHGGGYSAVVATGGLFRPLDGGVYLVDRRMLTDARQNRQGEHASNLGCALANDLAGQYQCPAYVVDPISVDEFEPLAYYSGHPLIKRKSLSHALNIHAVARRAAQEVDTPLNQSTFIIGHLGGGISIAPVRGGRIIDVNDAASDGPFSSERTGGLPLQQFLKICYSGKYSQEELSHMVMGSGGLVAYLGTNSLVEVEQRITRGDEVAREVLAAMAYQIAKEIGAMATVLSGDVNAIVLTGGAAQSQSLVSMINKRVSFIAHILVHPGEDEMSALGEAALRVLCGEEQLKEFSDDTTF